jgi:hypothetical protein
MRPTTSERDVNDAVNDADAYQAGPQRLLDATTCPLTSRVTLVGE